MKRLFYCLISMLPLTGMAQSSYIIAAKALVQRIVPSYSDRIIFENLQSNATNDMYTLESLNGKIIIKGNSINAMAVGLNEYLRNYCNVDFSWYRNEGISLPLTMPDIPTQVSKEARCNERFFLNYCTFGYTMPWWQWKDWQWFIDWMSLNGVNMPLAITGEESIWYKVWKKFGLTDEQIRSYFTGPAYLPWHRMSNIDHWDGPLPKSWINNQFELQKKILKRERELGMKPVLPAFAGHVPEVLKAKYPNAKITSLGDWAGFSSKYNSYFLDPFDSLFKPIQKAFLEEQSKAFGSNHIYGADPFNEVTPPSWSPDYLSKVSKVIYHSVAETDPEAEWLQMGWIFHYQRKNWTNERIEAYLNAVPPGKMTMLDYFCDDTEVWKQTNSFFGQPFIWCYLGNFGGNTMMSGDLKEVEKRMENTFVNGGKNMKGVGSTLEGFGVNHIMYEYVLDKVWNKGSVDIDNWVEKWSERRYGRKNENVTKAWDILLNTVYSSSIGLGNSTLTNDRPALSRHTNGTINSTINYDNKDLLKAWHLLSGVKGNAPSVYYYDVVDVGRQVLENYFLILRDRFTKSYDDKNMVALKKNGNAMLSLLDDMDRLLATNQNCLLGTWIDNARKFGINRKEKNYYEEDARKIITVWGKPGGLLTDYANRSVAGLTKTYYRGRWKMFIEGIEQSLQNNTPFNEAFFTKKLTAFEDNWIKGHEKYSSKSDGNCISLSKFLLKKYAKGIESVE